MAKDVNPPRGMRDFLPAEKAKRDRVLGVIRETYRSHGYQEIETPALEDLSRLTSGQGGDNEKLAYRVMKRGEELERALADTSENDNLADLGLRFDLTVPLTRYYATNAAKLPRVFKAIQTGPVWRAERPQKGRYRQFVQCDIDIIGDPSVLAEIDLLVSSLDALDAIGLKDAKIRVNDRRILNAFLNAAEISEGEAQKALIELDKLDKSSTEDVTDAIRPLSKNHSAIDQYMKPFFEAENLALKNANLAIRMTDSHKRTMDALNQSVARAINPVIHETIRKQLESSLQALKVLQDSYAKMLSPITESLSRQISAMANLNFELDASIANRLSTKASGIISNDFASSNENPEVVEDLKASVPLILDETAALQNLFIIFSAVNSVHPDRLIFDKNLVRGMGYYTGTIFEISHPASGSSIGGGGRYDGMVGRWTGTDVAAVGISIGFERVVDLVSETDAVDGGVVLVLENESAAVVAQALRLQAGLIAEGRVARLEQRPKKLNILLDALAEQGFSSWAAVDGSGATPELKPLA